MGIVDDLLRLQAGLASDRAAWEDTWRDVVALAMPYASPRYDSARGSATAAPLTGFETGPKAAERSRELYDSTAAWALDRLTAGMESLVTPRAQKWHGLALDDPFAGDPADVEEEWLEALRDYLFGARYDARSGFSLANQRAIRAACGIGVGIVYSEENMGRRDIDPRSVPTFYRSVPVAECYLGIDAFDAVDRNIRLHDMTARAAVSYFGEDKVSAKVKAAAESAKDSEKTFTFMHAVLPREEAGSMGARKRDAAFASFWAEVETRHLIRDSGFNEFPFSVYTWDQQEGSAYGSSPIMSVLADLKMLQVMSKSAIQAAQQLVKPPMATMSGIYSHRLNLNPGASNPGYLGEDHRLKAQPLITAQDPSFAERIMEAKRQGVRESLYVTLFQILLENPQMTATEALIRANEKGELLGPAGAKIQQGLAQTIEREIGIVERKGAFQPESPLAPPPSLAGRSVSVRFTAPIDRLRRMAELQGADMVAEKVMAVAQFDPSAIDRLDTDQYIELTQEIGGAPRKLLRTDEEVAALREARAQREQAAAAMQMAEQGAKAAKDGVPAVREMAEMAEQGALPQ